MWWWARSSEDKVPNAIRAVSTQRAEGDKNEGIPDLAFVTEWRLWPWPGDGWGWAQSARASISRQIQDYTGNKVRATRHSVLITMPCSQATGIR